MGEEKGKSSSAKFVLFTQEEKYMQSKLSRGVPNTDQKKTTTEEGERERKGGGQTRGHEGKGALGKWKG